MCADEGRYFKAAVHLDGVTHVVDVGGELDLAGRCALSEACLVGDGIHVLVDMTALTFMDCGGYGGLIAARIRAEALGGSLNLRGAVAQPARLLDLIKRLECQPNLPKAS